MTIDNSIYKEFLEGDYLSEKQEEDVKPLIGTPAEFAITIKGKKIDSEIMSLELLQYVDSHHVFVITLLDVGRATADVEFASQNPYTSFLGESISLKITPQGSDIEASFELTFIGTITQVDLKNSIDGLNVGVITAHSPSIALDGAPKNKFYYDQSASDIISAVLNNYPMTLDKIDATSNVKEYCVQYRETDYDFISRLASENGQFAYYDGQGFSVQKAVSGSAVDLIWRESLGAFSLGLGTAPVKFSSQAYTYTQKKTFTQDSESLPASGALSALSKLSPDASKNLYSQPGYAGASRPVADARSLDHILESKRGDAMGGMIKCSGTSSVPAVSVGNCIRVKGMGPVDGTYWVLAVRHTIEAGMYSNNFFCTPLDMAYPRYRSSLNRITQLQSAVVTNNNDPEALGRVKVTFPWSDSQETSWIRVITPHAGAERGFFHIPEVDDEVVVGYEQGNPDRPLIVGSVYNSTDKPQEGTGGEGNNVKSFKTRSGHEMVFDDTDGAEKFTITAMDGSQIVIDAANKSISIKSEGDVSIVGAGDMSIKAANIKIEADQEITVKAGTNMNLEASANMKSKAGATCDVEGGATVNVKGGMINLN